MHLQLTGRLDPGEKFATLSLDGADLFSGQKMTNLALLSVVFCHQSNHTHFPGPVKALYPVDPSRYPETVTIHRKTRSVQTDSNDNASDNENDDDNDDDDDSQPPRPKRQKREAQNVSDPASPRAAARQILPMEIKYHAGFRKTVFDFTIDNFREESPKTLIDNVLAKQHADNVSNHFQQLLQHPIKYALLSGREPARGQKLVQITLPPLIRFMCNDKKLFALLGFVEASQPSQITGKNIWYLENPSRTESKIFLATSEINPNVKFNFHTPKSKPANSYTIHVQRLEPNFSSVLTLDTFCQQNSTATLKFFKLILEGTVEALSLPTDSLQAKLVTSDVISLEKAVSLQNESDAPDNFHFFVQLGSHIFSLLGVASSEIAWSISRKIEIKMTPSSLTDSLSADTQDRCQHVIDNLPNMFLNQTSENEIVKRWQARWQQYLTEMEAVTARKQEEDSVQSDTEISKGDDGLGSDAQQPMPPPPPPPNIQIISEDVAGTDSTTIEESSDISSSATTTATATTTTTTMTTTTTSDSVISSHDAESSTQRQPTPPPPPPPPPPPRLLPPSDVSSSTHSDETTIVINNPDRRPATDYIVANSIRPHTCSNPLTFPDNCTLIVREGEPTDYLATRGYCSVLGLFRKEKQPSVLSNGSFLRAGQNLNSLSIEIVDDALNTYMITGETSMWIKLNLQCTSSSSSNNSSAY